LLILTLLKELINLTNIALEVNMATFIKM
jgi:hypothetical protein